MIFIPKGVPWRKAGAGLAMTVSLQKYKELNLNSFTMMRLEILVVLCAVSLPAFVQRASVDAFLPVDTADWRRVEKPQSFVGDELFKMIDGGAALYQEYGFDRAVSAHFQDGAGRTVDAEIYAMSDSAAAYGIFSITAASGEKQLALGDEGELGEYFLVFRKGRHVVTVSGQNSDKVTMDGVKLLGQAIEARIDSSSRAPQFVVQFNPLVAKDSRPIYLRGAIAVGNFYMFAPHNVFSIREGLTGDRDSTRFFVFRYPNAKESERTFHTATKALRSDEKYSAFKSSPTRFQTIDRDGNLLIASVADNSIVIIVGPRKDLNEKMEKQALEILGRPGK